MGSHGTTAFMDDFKRINLIDQTCILRGFNMGPGIQNKIGRGFYVFFIYPMQILKKCSRGIFLEQGEKINQHPLPLIILELSLYEAPLLILTVVYISYSISDTK